MAVSEVTSLLGDPLARSWIYESPGNEPLVVYWDEVGRISHISGPESERARFPAGSDIVTVSNALGRPTAIAYGYSESPTDSHYRIRSVVFKNDVVYRVIDRYWWD